MRCHSSWPKEPPRIHAGGHFLTFLICSDFQAAFPKEGMQIEIIQGQTCCQTFINCKGSVLSDTKREPLKSVKELGDFDHGDRMALEMIKRECASVGVGKKFIAASHRDSFWRFCLSSWNLPKIAASY